MTSWISRYGFTSFLLLAVVRSVPDAHNPKGRLLKEGEPISTAAETSSARTVDYKLVKTDLFAMFKHSQPFWPTDNHGHYGPLMIRYAWHCSGTYRTWDGRGGCDGAHMRFEPVQSWEDNVNLDKARALLLPIKTKYGPSLSWGDLIILAGNAAIESMGGPVLGFCGGRIDSTDNIAILPLGPSPQQEAIAPCKKQGACPHPLGTTKVGLMYADPAGPMESHDPAKSAAEQRDVFHRKGWTDEELVALVGGGHKFGKAHGACKTGPGQSPKENSRTPWTGTCGSGPLKGKGNNTFTSGYEGSWTDNPTEWNTDYFKYLVQLEWKIGMGPGGKKQWKPVKVLDPEFDEDLEEIQKTVMMLTSDIAFINDAKFKKIVQKYAFDQAALDAAFSEAWYKVTTRDMGPPNRCVGGLAPQPRPWQCALPPPPKIPPRRFVAVKQDIQNILHTTNSALEPDTADNKPYYGALFATLAWQCASTFRATDYRGGCNGAHIRFSPAKDWPSNVGMNKALDLLANVKGKYPMMTYADLIVLAGVVAIEEAAGRPMRFCGGRSDATDGCGMEDLAPRVYPNGAWTAVRDNMVVMGMTIREGVALMARPRSPTHQKRLGYSGSWTSDVTKLSNEYFEVLMNEKWVKAKSSSGKEEYRARSGKALYMTEEDMVVKGDKEMAAIAAEFAADNEAFLATFYAAWVKLMNSDRFDGPMGNVCGARQGVSGDAFNHV